MPSLQIILEGDKAWPDLVSKGWKHGLLEAVARLSLGMQSGASSVGLRIKLDDGTYVIAETSMALFLGAALAFKTKEEMPTSTTPH